MMPVENIQSALDLQYKAILSLYDSQEKLKSISTDISGSLQSICADVYINQLKADRVIINMDRVIGIIEVLTPSIAELIHIGGNTEKNVENNKKNAELMGNLLSDRIDSQHKFLKMAVTEIDNINRQRRTDKFYNLCFYCFYCGVFYIFFKK